MRSPVELRARAHNRFPDEEKEARLWRTARGQERESEIHCTAVLVFSPSITLPRSSKCDTAQLHMKDLNITLKANETQIAKTSLNNFRE